MAPVQKKEIVILQLDYHIHHDQTPAKTQEVKPQQISILLLSVIWRNLCKTSSTIIDSPGINPLGVIVFFYGIEGVTINFLKLF
jgi:hypothetical protein